MNYQTLRVGIDVGSARHRVAVELPDGKLIDEFDIDHHAEGFGEFFRRVGAHVPNWFVRTGEVYFWIRKRQRQFG